jgi:tetratricopeptide (TPR) repeat protein
MFGRLGAATAATALYATCLPTFFRAAGNYLREDFASPALLAATALAWALLARPPGRLRGRLAVAGALALSIAYALSCWHMAQFYLNVLLAAILLAALVGRPGLYGPLGLGFLVGTAAAAAFNPPLLAKGVLWSPTVAASAVLAAWGFVPAGRSAWGRAALGGGTAAAVALSLGVVGSGAYGHAYALLASKLRLLGIHPEDPRRLPVDARIFWMGPYDTTTLRRALLEYGPLLAVAAVTYVAAVARRRRGGSTGLSLFPAAMTAATAFLYWFLVRLTIFFAPWAAALGAWPAARARRRSLRLAGAGLALALVAFQIYWAFNFTKPTWPRRLLERLPQKEDALWDYGTRDNDVFLWFRDHTPEGSAVLAQFGISASLMYWGERPVALHPMYEVPEIRDKIVAASRAYMGPEEDLYALCRRWRVAYVLYNAPIFLRYEPPGDRYFAATPDPPADAVGRKMQFAPEELRLFRLRYETYSFRVFEVGRPYDGYRAVRYHPFFDASVFADLPTAERFREVSRGLERAGRHYASALAAEEAGAWSAAAARYGLALSLHPDYEEAELRLGYCLARLGRYEEAEPHFRRALLTDPENARAHTYMGSFYLSTGDYTSALAEYRRAYELDPDDPENLGRLRMVEKLTAGG